MFTGLVESIKSNFFAPTSISVSELLIYPVKSCGPLKLEKVKIGKYGFELDRIWAVTNSDYKNLMGKSHPKLELIMPTVVEVDGKTMVKLESSFISRPLFLDPFPTKEGEGIEFLVWKYKVHVYDIGEEASTWFSEALGEEGCRVVFKSSRPRPALGLYLERDGFGDLKPETSLTACGFPILVTSEESLIELRKHLPEDVKDQIGQVNFRPNLVIRGCSRPFQEDEFGVIRINDVTLHCDEPCARCTITNVNPSNGIPHQTEPLKTLMRIRRCFPHISKYEPFFGVCAIPLKSEGTISVGDPLEIVTRTEK